jgi:hypothetical protein
MFRNFKTRIGGIDHENNLCRLTIFIAGTQNLTAAPVGVIDGQTSVALDFRTLSSAASLDLSSVSSDVIAPGNLPDSVAFGINKRDAPALATTFLYTTPALAPFSGTIEHTVSVFSNEDTVEVGNLTIGFDPGRVGMFDGEASGFYVESTAGISAILFDIENPTSLQAEPTQLVITADLLVSPEFGGFLFDNKLSQANLQGFDVGEARVDAAAAVVPAPGAFILGGIGATLVGYLRGRRAV